MPASRKKEARNNCFSLQPPHQVTRETSTSAACTVLLVSQKGETSAPDMVDLNLYSWIRSLVTWLPRNLWSWLRRRLEALSGSAEKDNSVPVRRL